jgi:hypothetical protein
MEYKIENLKNFEEVEKLEIKNQLSKSKKTG